MKKEVIITARITQEIKETIQTPAERDERTLAWMIRKLILEALEARSLPTKLRNYRCITSARLKRLTDQRTNITVVIRSGLFAGFRTMPGCTLR